VGRQRQHADGLRRGRVSAENRIRLDNVDHPALLVKVKQVERNPDTPFGQPSKGRHPEAFAGLKGKGRNPLFQLSQRKIGHIHFQSEEAFTSLVVRAKFP